MSGTPLDQALREADQCVKCGLCLSHCPTYQLYNNENESPRGRIALAEGLLRGQLLGDRKLADHLYRCLLCRRCETVCPSGVRYASLIDQARARLPRPHWSTELATHPALAKLLGTLGRSVPIPGSTLSALAQALPYRAAPKPGVYPPLGRKRGRVGLFLGCVTRTHQGGALTAALHLLRQLGYEVIAPEAQVCCGALDLHQGDPDSASRMLQSNRLAFREVDTLLSVASGCSLQLIQHDTHPRAMDIVDFLLSEIPKHTLVFRPLDALVALHQPCTQVNGLRQAGLAGSLLQHIPGLVLQPLGEPGSCCGAAGDHLLTERVQAETLRQPFLDQLLTTRPRYLLSSNIGCALHLAEGARTAGLQIETLHPVELLARQLEQ